MTKSKESLSHQVFPDGDNPSRIYEIKHLNQFLFICNDLQMQSQLKIFLPYVTANSLKLQTVNSTFTG